MEQVTHAPADWGRSRRRQRQPPRGHLSIDEPPQRRVHLRRRGSVQFRRQRTQVRLHRIVQPRLLVVMGDDAREFLNGVAFPLSQPLPATLGELQPFTPTIEALVVPDIDLCLDDQPAKTSFWNAFKSVGPWWAALPPY